MVFSSVEFILFFLPIFLIVYYITPVSYRNVVLLFGSLIFYAYGEPKYIVLLLVSMVLNYWLARGMASEKSGIFLRKGCFYIGILTNLSLLLAFKIAPQELGLPLGISFYTFQIISYLIDVYRKDIPVETSLLKLSTYICMFPQLVAGPIERSTNLLKQFDEPHTFETDRVREGLLIMLWGLFMKIMIADNLATCVDLVYQNYPAYTGVEIALATVLFAFQIYCDFGGYTYLAIGSAKVLGFSLMENFNAPYQALSVKDFWKRWHISLTGWFTDYLYIPLGGNRKGKLRKYLNTFIVFFVSGLWHGASWHFVAWGGINGLYQIVGDILKPIRDKLTEIFIIDRKVMSHKILKVVTTFIFVDISWIFFRADSISDAFAIVNGICTRIHLGVLINGSLMQIGIDKKQFIILLAALIILISIDVCKYMKVNLIERLCEQGAWFQYIVYLFLIYSILIFGNYGPTYDASQFIYFQF